MVGTALFGDTPTRNVISGFGVKIQASVRTLSRVATGTELRVALRISPSTFDAAASCSYRCGEIHRIATRGSGTSCKKPSARTTAKNAVGLPKPGFLPRKTPQHDPGRCDSQDGPAPCRGVFAHVYRPAPANLTFAVDDGFPPFWGGFVAQLLARQ